MVVREVRDRGPMWKDDMVIVRGEELVLWGTLDAANYNYIMQYIFRDEGTIGFRVAATSRNLPGKELMPHMHDGLWRIDVNLDGPENNSVYLVEHIEPDGMEKSKARSEVTPFNGGKEGFADFVPEKFTTLRIVNDRRKNAQGKPLPMRIGIRS